MGHCQPPWLGLGDSDLQTLGGPQFSCAFCSRALPSGTSAPLPRTPERLPSSAGPPCLLLGDSSYSVPLCSMAFPHPPAWARLSPLGNPKPVPPSLLLPPSTEEHFKSPFHNTPLTCPGPHPHCLREPSLILSAEKTKIFVLSLGKKKGPRTQCLLFSKSLEHVVGCRMQQAGLWHRSAFDVTTWSCVLDVQVETTHDRPHPPVRTMVFMIIFSSFVAV